MNYIFHPEAEAEFLNAVDYYEACEIDLGYDFSIEVYSTIENILSFPKAWPILEDDIRRCQTRRFPYGIVYAQEGDEIVILAVMHLRRDPGYWKGRLK
ncbi:MAG: type II toxin-antitoxin system RelE/ParE family toxin [Desulfobulbaceae bacterium]|nr:type II toxin-antitoxin system RelE/ParE family toxin [Desulfobulbaceae bacterium]